MQGPARRETVSDESVAPGVIWDKSCTLLLAPEDREQRVDGGGAGALAWRNSHLDGEKFENSVAQRPILSSCSAADVRFHQVVIPEGFRLSIFLPSLLMTTYIHICIHI